MKDDNVLVVVLEAEEPPQEAELAKRLSRLDLQNMRKWWNWQTHHLEGVAPKGMGVQVPPSAPNSLNPPVSCCVCPPVAPSSAIYGPQAPFFPSPDAAATEMKTGCEVIP
jgi:hypothetical protein